MVAVRVQNANLKNNNKNANQTLSHPFPKLSVALCCSPRKVDTPCLGLPDPSSPPSLMSPLATSNSLSRAPKLPGAPRPPSHPGLLLLRLSGPRPALCSYSSFAWLIPTYFSSLSRNGALTMKLTTLKLQGLCQALVPNL